MCISDFARSQLMALSDPAEWEKLHVIHCGIPLGAFTPSEQSTASEQGARILCVGRLVPEKGQAVLLSAVARLAERGHDVRLTLVGEGPDRERLEGTAARLAITQRVLFAGAIGQDDIAAIYGSASIFCLASFAEGVPCVLMEAMAMGLPVVSTRIMGIPELIEENHGGLLVAPGRADELASALERLLADTTLIEKLTANARAKVLAEFDCTATAKELHALLVSELSPSRPTVRSSGAR